MDTPSHRYTEHHGDKRSADPRRLSPHTTDGASLDELRREWRRLYCGSPEDAPPSVGNDRAEDNPLGVTLPLFSLVFRCVKQPLFVRLFGMALKIVGHISPDETQKGCAGQKYGDYSG